MYEEHVKRGVAWLDLNKPGWRSQIDLSTFDMREIECCVIGQLYPYAGAFCKIGATILFDCGFDLPDELYGDKREEAWAALQAEWTKEIKGGGEADDYYAKLQNS